MRRLLFILFVALVCAPLSFADRGASSCFDKDLEEWLADSLTRQFRIDEVQVTAHRNSSSAVIPVQTLEGKHLEQLQVQSVADALRYFSGVQIKDYGGVGGVKTIDVRSMGSHHLGVFYDGIEVGNAQNGTVDLGKFSMENIEGLSLYNGQKSEILQPAKDYGSAGTLYIRTRRPKFDMGKNYHLVATMKAGTFGLANPSLLYEQKLSEHIHLSLNAEYTYATGRYHFRIHKKSPDGTTAWDTTGVRQNGDMQAFRAEAGVFGYLPQGKWHLKGYYYQSERGIPRAIIRNLWTSAQRQWDRNAFVQGSFQNDWDLPSRTDGGTLSLLMNAKYSNDYMRYLNPDTTLMYVDNHFTQQEVYLSAAIKYAIFRWWDVSLSGDYQWNKLDASLANFAYPHRHTELMAAATAFHYKWINAQASVLGTFVQDRISRRTSDVRYAAAHFHRFTPAVFLSVQPYLKEQLFLRAFYKKIFRMPTFNDLYYTDLGNISLKPEDATQWDGGVEYTKRLLGHSVALQDVTLHLKADGYFNRIDNKIVAVPKGNSQYRWMMMNLGKVEIRGVDLNAGLNFCFRYDITLDLQGTYTYQKAQDKTDPNDPVCYNGQINYIPWHSCSATACLAWKGWALHYAFIYVGERYHNSANIPANYEQPWYTHDLSLQKLFPFKTWKLSTAVELNNFLNQQYDVILNYPMPGINGKIIIKFII